ncbi:phosphoglucosamine mutase [Candidatus Bathyarchaeota archaeon]|nr:phosphoglucosamine mutase [Candidatus Bathyarchaeota archaeon]
MAAPSRRLFGTNGVRGVVNRELTPEFVLLLTEAIGTFFGRSKILVGWDGRTSSPILSDLVASGLMSAGCTVYELGMAPTPAVQYLAKAGGFNGAVMVTASHNPPEYNGIKVMDFTGVEIPPEGELAIEKIYFKKQMALRDWNSLGEKLPAQDRLEAYRRAIMERVDQDVIRRSRFKVVVDAANGVGSLTTPYLCRELGCEVVTINSHIDGTFPGRLPEPTPANLDSLCRTVRSVGADVGVAHDGDADRAIFVDEKGQVHWGDMSFALIAEHYLKQGGGREVVTPVSSSQVIEDIASKYGGKVVWTPVGSPYVSRTMIARGAGLGGEENGGIFYAPHIPVRDGGMATALMLEVMATAGERLSTLTDRLPRYFNIKDKVPCPSRLKSRVLRQVKKEAEGYRVETTDGLKIWHRDRSWILIRPSGTEPVYRLFAEARSKEEAERLSSRYKAVISRAVKRNVRRS